MECNGMEGGVPPAQHIISLRSHQVVCYAQISATFTYMNTNNFVKDRPSFHPSSCVFNSCVLFCMCVPFALVSVSHFLPRYYSMQSIHRINRRYISSRFILFLIGSVLYCLRKQQPIPFQKNRSEQSRVESSDRQRHYFKIIRCICFIFLHLNSLVYQPSRGWMDGRTG